MTWYVAIKPRQQPSDIGTDPDTGRALVVFTVDVFKRSSETFVDEMIALAESAGGLTFGDNLFESQQARLPGPGEEPGQFVVLTTTPGLADETNHDAIGAYEKPALIVTAAAPDSVAAMVLGRSLYRVFKAVRNREIVP